MGGLGPGIGGFEILVVGIVALLVVGPKDLPVLMRKVGQFMGRARSMANEFRASFDEMARQSELDDLRKEVEALRQGQMVPLGAEANAAFSEINTSLNAGLATAPQPNLTGPEEFAEPAPMPAPSPAASAPEPSPTKPRKASASSAKAKPAVSKAPAPAKPAARKASKPAAAKSAPAKPKPRKKVEL